MDLNLNKSNNYYILYITPSTIKYFMFVKKMYSKYNSRSDIEIIIRIWNKLRNHTLLLQGMIF